MSNVPLLYNRRARDFFLEWRKAGFWGRLGLAFGRLRPGLFKPVPALELGLTDPICGLNMGQTAEVLAKEFGITRAEQDEFALRSHQRAVAAWKRGFFTDEVVPVPANVTGGAAVTTGHRPAAEPVARSAGQAEADLRSQERHRHAGQQLPDHRRRRRARPDSGRQARRPPAARVHPRLRPGRVRSAADGARAGVRHSQAAPQDRHSARGLRVGRDQRGVRGPGSCVQEGDGLRRVRPERTGRRQGGGRTRSAKG